MRILEYDPSLQTVQEPGFDRIRFETTKLILATDPSLQELEALGKGLGIPLQVLQEYMDEKERPAVVGVVHYTAIVFEMPVKRKGRSETASFCIFSSEKATLFLSRHPLPSAEWFFSLPRETLLLHVKRGSSYVIYLILEKVMDQYFEEQARIEERVNALENEVVNATNQNAIREIFREKSSLIYLMRALTADRDVVLELEKGSLKGADQESLVSFRFIYNDIVQLIDMMSMNREMISSTIDIYMTAVSNNLTVTINKLTAWGSLVLIPTFIASVYGMNFRHLPELDWQYGYPFALGIMVLSVVILYLHFRRKKYL